MTSGNDVSRHIFADSRRASSAAEPLIDGGRRSGSDRSCHEGGDTSEDQTQAQRGDDPVLEPTCRRQTQNEFLYAMKEDLGDWLGALYGVDISADEFFEKLETGTLLCRHANAVYDRLRHRTKNDTHSEDGSGK